ncbi:restriction endonuclease [Solirubrobacter soli]|uniref:restriction endonuclease n=1 Tax=Solirubrobacter soli TaxID=363832 RepID=UPI001B7FAC5E|nr:restriction endonuclease [Solirubrobacter soli]
MRAIAEHLGVDLRTAYRYLAATVCRGCGGPALLGVRCRACLPRARPAFGRDEIIEALKAWTAGPMRALRGSAILGAMPTRVAYADLPTADLTIGTIYEQGPQPDIRAEPLHRLLPGVGNQGGFRTAGSVQSGSVKFAVLFSSGEDLDWPDRLDEETGQFTYFGDNKVPGSDLHATSRSGNRLLRACFDALHGEPPQRHAIPPFFVFRKAAAGGGRDVTFLGLAVPGAAELLPGADLVAIWRTTAGQRFQNYRAIFTILDTGTTVARAWIGELATGSPPGPACPPPFHGFIDNGKYTPLRAARTRTWRAPAEQGPATTADAALLRAITDHFHRRHHEFEACAIALWRMMAKEAVSFIEGTRRSRDGGRDAIGRYSLGPQADQIHLDFSLEAKCYAPSNLSGVRDVARLISRLRHRQFGVFVTTSGLNRQAYAELRDDQHPVVVICGRDITDLLKEHGYATPEAVKSWLSANFPPM